MLEWDKMEVNNTSKTDKTGSSTHHSHIGSEWKVLSYLSYKSFSVEKEEV